MKLSRGREGNPGRTVSLEIMFWKDPNGNIYMGTNDAEAPDFLVEVTESALPTLYRRLDAYLRMKGAV